MILARHIYYIFCNRCDGLDTILKRVFSIGKMGNMPVAAFGVKCKVQIETSDDNLKKISELFKALQSGELDGQVIRPPMQVGEIVKAVGVSRNTFHLWKNGEVMPMPGNLRAIALNLLKVTEQDLANYFAGNSSLKDLLAIRVKVTTPDEVYQTFQQLRSDREKDAVLALLLQERAKKLGNDLIKNESKTDTIYPQMGEIVMSDTFWKNERVCQRVQNLIKASLKKQRLVGQPGTAAERQGVPASSFDWAALRAFESGTLKQMLETWVDGGLENAIASICYEVIAWNADNTPLGLGDRTYKDRPEQLMRDLQNFVGHK